jgi:hypothetical protein
VIVERLAGLVASAVPLRRVLARLAGRLVDSKGWERLGFARLGDYAVERVGLSARQLYELARVDETLGALPGVEAALLSGRISWTKARLLCRVATVLDEAHWLGVAEQLSARALSREVRKVDARSLERGGGAPQAVEGAARAWAPEGEEPRETVRLGCTRAVHGKWWAARQLAQRAAGERLAPWQCAEWIAAEVLSATGLEVEPEPVCEAKRSMDNAGTNRVAEAIDSPALVAPSVPTGAAPQSERVDAVATGSPSLPTFLHALLTDLDSADAFALDARLRRAVRLEQRHLARVGPWLLAVAQERLFRDLGYRCLDAYARDELGMAASKARALLRIERVASVSLLFRKAWQAGELTWTQAEALAPLFVLEHSGPWQAAWLALARAVTVRRLRDDVDRAVSLDLLDPGAHEYPPAGLLTGAKPTESGEGIVPAEKRREAAEFFFRAPRDVARIFRAVLATVQRRIERAENRGSSQSEALELMFEHVFEVWGRWRPVPKKYRVFDRDGWRCAVPGCSGYRELHDHHIVFRSAGGSDALENRVTLCAWHHLRGVHAGVVGVRGKAPEGLRFSLGLRETGPPLAVYGSGDRVVAA